MNEMVIKMSMKDKQEFTQDLIGFTILCLKKTNRAKF